MPSHVESRECQLNRMKGWAAQVAAVSATEAKQEKLMDCSAHSAPRARTHRIGAPCPLSSNRLLRDHILVARTRTTVVLWLFSREGQNESSAQLEAGLRVGQHCNANNEVKRDSQGNHPWTPFLHTRQQCHVPHMCAYLMDPYSWSSGGRSGPWVPLRLPDAAAGSMLPHGLENRACMQVSGIRLLIRQSTLNIRLRRLSTTEAKNVP
ncbi:hypothetical protein C8Q72DRAFT_659352 [Fomitopsis betulina]|nr:hypothetical protein C8Q72DRAFT_659352 [Fomitopsis betulina]